MTRVRVCGGLSVFVVAVALLVGAPSAMAQLPGGSAVDEYTENVPGPAATTPATAARTTAAAVATPADTDSGDTSTTPGAGAGTDTSSGRRLRQRRGRDPIERVQQWFAGDRVRNRLWAVDGSGSSSAAITSARGQDAPATVTSQPTSATTVPRDDDGATGVVLPIALAIVLLAIAAIPWYRRRHPEELVERPQRVRRFRIV